MLFQQKVFTRRHSTFKPEQLMKPRVSKQGTFKFPQNSILNYLPQSEVEIGPSSNLPYFKDPRVIFVRHITELADNKGNPKNNMVLPGPLIQTYRKANPKLRLITRWENADKEPQNLVVINYSILQRIRRYAKTAWAAYFKWYNIFSTVVQTMNDLAHISDRQQFIVLEMPKDLISIALIRKHERRASKRSISQLKDETGFTFADILAWVGPNREHSILNKLEADSLSKINIVFTLYGRWMSINLGTLNGWIKVGENKKGLAPKSMQLRFIKLLNTFIQSQIDGEITKLDMTEEYDEADLETAPAEDVDEEDDIISSLDNIEEVDEAEMQIGILDDDSNFDDEDDSEIQLGDDDDDEDDNIAVVENKVTAETTIEKVSDSKHVNPEDTIVNKVEKLFEDRLITIPERKRFITLASSYKEMDDPFGSDQTLEQAMQIDPKEVVLKRAKRIPDMDILKDKSMVKTTVEDMNEQYVTQLLKKNVMQAVMSLQKADIAVTNYTVERETNAVNDFEVHTISTVPLVGKPGTIRFTLPVVQPNGVYMSNGVRYRLKTQKIDVPIRKVSPVRVGITTHYAKLFIERSNRVRFDEDKWLANALFLAGRDEDNKNVTNMRVNDVSDIRVHAPSIYSVISNRVSYFESNELVFCFDHVNIHKVVNRKKADIEAIEADGKYIVCGVHKRNFIVVDHENMFHSLAKSGKTTLLGTIIDICNLDVNKRPLPMAELKLFGKTIPLGVVISFLLGFHPMLEKLDVKYRTTFPGDRLNLGRDEFAVKFSDRTYIFNREDDLVTMLMSGFVMYAAGFSEYSVYSFDKRAVYLNVFERYGIGVRYTKEFVLMDAMLIDPVSKSILEDMNEPTEVPDLLIRAVDMLRTRYVPDRLTDASFEGLERSAGYERFARTVYSELVKSVRRFNSRQVVSTGQLSMNPFAVSMAILQEPAKELINDINPIHNLKEKESLTYGGSGGRSRRSMTADDRLFQETDLGYISESGVDSSDVGIITYVSPNANYTSVYGTVRMFDEKTDGTSSLLSTSALLAPMIDRDDPKRAGFTAILNSHGISSIGNTTMPLRTGAEDTIAFRNDEMFATSSKQKGIVTKVNKEHIEVQYEDGTKAAFPLGRTFGLSTGTTVPFTMSTNLKEGEEFGALEILTYNSDFYAPNPLNKGCVTLKFGTLTKLAISESSLTFEDSSGISQNLAERMASWTTDVKYINVRFDQIVTDLVKVGDAVDLESVLCYIEDSVDGRSMFDDKDSISGLSSLSRMAPRAGVKGTVERLEVFYHGDLEDMTVNLQTLCTRADKDRKRVDRMLGRPVITGQVDQSLRINGNGLELDNIVIKVYMTHLAPMGIGDKLVVGNQMKSVNGVVFKEPVVSQRGTIIDMNFGNKSIDDRIVNSPKLIGSTCTLLRLIGEQAVDLYFS